MKVHQLFMKSLNYLQCFKLEDSRRNTPVLFIIFCRKIYFVRKNNSISKKVCFTLQFALPIK